MTLKMMMTVLSTEMYKMSRGPSLEVSLVVLDSNRNGKEDMEHNGREGLGEGGGWKTNLSEHA
jgi:hypothetical protein